MKRHTQENKCRGVDDTVLAQAVPNMDTTMSAPSIDCHATLRSLGLTLCDYPTEPQWTGDLPALPFGIVAEASWTGPFNLLASPFPTSDDTAAHGGGTFYELGDVDEEGLMPYVQSGLDSEVMVDLSTSSIQAGFPVMPRFGSAVGADSASICNFMDREELSPELAGFGDLPSISRERSRESEASRPLKRLRLDNSVQGACSESAAQSIEIATDSAVIPWQQNNGYSPRPASTAGRDPVEHLSVVSRSHISAEANQLALFRRTESQPRTYKQYTAQSWSKSEAHSNTRSSTTIRQTLAVKTFMASDKGRYLLASDRRTLIWELVRKGAKLTYTHSVLSGDQVLFKNSRFPRIIDDNAEIFRLCSAGQYDEVNRWFSIGKASIVDMDSKGHTLLHADLCRLLLARGADVHARNWVASKDPFSGTLVCLTAFGSACRSGPDPNSTASRSCETQGQLIDTLRVLIEGGTDLGMAMEVDDDMIYLQYALSREGPVFTAERMYAAAYMYAVRMYARDVTCDGLLQIEGPHRNLMSVQWRQELEIANVGHSQDSAVRIFGRSDYAPLQYYLVYVLSSSAFRDTHFRAMLQPLDLYTGDFHFRLPFEWDGHSRKIAPLDLATWSAGALSSFQTLLAAYDVDLDKFITKGCSMADCKWTEGCLTILLSFQWEFLVPIFHICRRCKPCRQWVGREGPLMNWSDLVTRIREATTIDSLFTAEENRHLSALATDPDQFMRQYYPCPRSTKHNEFAGDGIESRHDEDSASEESEESSELEHCDRLHESESGNGKSVHLPGESDTLDVATVEHEERSNQHRREIPFPAYHFLREDYQRRHYSHFSSPSDAQMRQRIKDVVSEWLIDS
ncbi:hypothetical protein LTR53_001964 [Teratosphaeriaceae sp. CCFEE 6253]|nr:hypothetical protein LTR53_001964 [Teratosphaeriaceae sp. CCFEE 6253]